MWLTFKFVRPTLPILSGFATWIIARACNAPFEHSVVAAFSMGLSTIGASIYHYGGANWMYTRKDERFKFKNPQIVMLVGLIFFALSIGIAGQCLPNKACMWISIGNAILIAAYSATLSAHWKTKNITMGVVCATPVLMGWQAGTMTHPIVIWAMIFALIAHLSREIIKDVNDIIANHGRRVTLPMRIGKEGALQIAGGLLIIAMLFAFGMMQFAGNIFQILAFGFSIGLLLVTVRILLLHKKTGSCDMLIHLSVGLMIMALL